MKYSIIRWPNYILKSDDAKEEKENKWLNCIKNYFGDNSACEQGSDCI